MEFFENYFMNLFVQLKDLEKQVIFFSSREWFREGFGGVRECEAEFLKEIFKKNINKAEKGRSGITMLKKQNSLIEEGWYDKRRQQLVIG